MRTCDNAFTLGDVPRASLQLQHLTGSGPSLPKSSNNGLENRSLSLDANAEAAGQGSSILSTQSNSSSTTSTGQLHGISQPQSEEDKKHKTEVSLASGVVPMVGVTDDRNDLENYIKCSACDFKSYIPKKGSGSFVQVASAMLDVKSHFKTAHAFEYRALKGVEVRRPF